MFLDKERQKKLFDYFIDGVVRHQWCADRIGFAKRYGYKYCTFIGTDSEWIVGLSHDNFEFSLVERGIPREYEKYIVHKRFVCSMSDVLDFTVDGIQGFCIDINEVPEMKETVVSLQEWLDSPALANQSTDISILEEPFKDHFSLNIVFPSPFDDYENFISTDEIRFETVFNDVESCGKYGIAIHKVYWKNECIGAVKKSGRYMEDVSCFTVNQNKWFEMMDYIHQEYMAKINKTIAEANYLTVIDESNSYNMLDHLPIEGYTEKTYSTD